MWTCPKCSYELNQTGLTHAQAARVMGEHIKINHPDHWAFIQYVEAMSRD